MRFGEESDAAGITLFMCMMRRISLSLENECDKLRGSGLAPMGEALDGLECLTPPPKVSNLGFFRK